MSDHQVPVHRLSTSGDAFTGILPQHRRKRCSDSQTCTLRPDLWAWMCLHQWDLQLGYNQCGRIVCVQAPKFYDQRVPPAPAGLTWWKYNADVPPLPQPKDYFRNTTSFDHYYWKYDASYFANDYTFSKPSMLALECTKQASSQSQKVFTPMSLMLTSDSGLVKL